MSLTLEPGELRELLIGRRSLSAGRDDRHVLDTLLHYAHLDPAVAADLGLQFRTLLEDEDLRVVSAAIHYFLEQGAEDDGGALPELLAWRGAALVGQHSPWYPEDRDLRTLLADAITRRIDRGDPWRQVVRDEALAGQAGTVDPLFVEDRVWLLDRLREMVDRNPECLDDLLTRLGFQDRVVSARPPGELVTRFRAARDQDVADLVAGLMRGHADVPVAPLEAMARLWPGGIPRTILRLYELDADLRPLLARLAKVMDPSIVRSAVAALPEGPLRIAYLASL